MSHNALPAQQLFSTIHVLVSALDLIDTPLTITEQYAEFKALAVEFQSIIEKDERINARRFEGGAGSVRVLGWLQGAQQTSALEHDLNRQEKIDSMAALELSIRECKDELAAESKSRCPRFFSFGQTEPEKELATLQKQLQKKQDALLVESNPQRYDMDLMQRLVEHDRAESLHILSQQAALMTMRIFELSLQLRVKFVATQPLSASPIFNAFAVSMNKHFQAFYITDKSNASLASAYSKFQALANSVAHTDYLLILAGNASQELIDTLVSVPNEQVAMNVLRA